MAGELNWSRITIDDMFEARRQAKEERSRRLAELPFEKKIEIVEQFNGILNSALREDDEHRASEQNSPSDKD